MMLSKSLIKIYSSLYKKKNRAEHGIFIVEGTKCVSDTLSYFSLEALIATQKWIDANYLICKKYTNCLYLSSARDIERISSLSTSTEVIAVYKIPEYIIDINDINENLTIMLDGVQDPGNLGTIIRVADWFGINQIIASKDTVDVFNPKTIQATMGAISRVKVFYVDTIDFIREHKYLPVYGTLLNGKNIYESTLSDKGIIIFGNEGKGISQELRTLIDKPLLIPPYPGGKEGSESLNVGIATAITISEFRRRIS